MGQIHDLRLRFNRFVENLDGTIISLIEGNQEIVELNRQQLADHKNSKDATIRPRYSPMWAEVKGFKDPDLKYTGALYKSMVITATGQNQYYIEGRTDYTEKLIQQYSFDIFGIAPSKQAKAKQITTKALNDLFVKQVLKR